MRLRRWGTALGLWAMASLALAGPVITVVMKDGTIKKGELLGVDAGTATLQKADGKSQDIPLSQVKKAFGADGKAVKLNAEAAASTDSGNNAADDAADAKAAELRQSQQPAAENADDEDAAPARHSRRSKPARQAAPHNNGLKGRKVAGEVLFWSGTAVTLVGLGCMLYGNSEESAATSTYCSTGLCSGQDYSPYTISGYPGYYTAAQYTQYYYGQDFVYTGVGLGCVGIVCMLAGAIVTPSARQMEEGSLLHYEAQDHQLSLGIPQMQVNRFGGPRANLLTATF